MNSSTSGTHAHDDSMLELASLHGLGVVGASEAASVDAHVRTCEPCRAAYMESAAIAAGFATSLATGAPPALRDRVLSAIDAERSKSRADMTTTQVIAFQRPRPSRWLGWSLSGGVAAALVVAVVVALNASHTRAPQPSPATVAHGKVYKSWTAACAPKPCTAGGSVVAFASGTIRLRLTGLRALPHQKVYQAWIIPPHATHPVPEPTFSADSRGNGGVAFAAKIPKGTVVAVTIEPRGGSKAPTSKPFLAAALN